MAYAFTQDVPIGWPIYEEIRKELGRALGEDPPAGLVVHVVMRTETGLRYLDVWESREAYRSFVDRTLHPIVGRALARSGAGRPPDPTALPIEVKEVWQGNARLG